MRRTDQSMAEQGSGALSSTGWVDGPGTSRFLLSTIESMVQRALRSIDPGLPTGTGGGCRAPGPGSDSSGNRTSRPSVVELDLRLPPAVPVSRMATLHATQEWEGYVVSVEEDVFVARLIDLTAGKSWETEEAVIPLEEISDHDAANLAIGRIFRWVIGRERSPDGTRKWVSQIVFRDLGRITESDLQRGREWARKIASTLNP